MHGEDRMVRRKVNSSWGYPFFFDIMLHTQLHTPGLRQVYKIMLYMRFNMLVEGSDLQRIQAWTLLHLQPLIMMPPKHVHLSAGDNVVLPGVQKCTRTSSCLVKPVCRQWGWQHGLPTHKCVSNLLYRSVALSCQRGKKNGYLTQ